MFTELQCRDPVKIGLDIGESADNFPGHSPLVTSTPPDHGILQPNAGCRAELPLPAVIGIDCEKRPVGWRQTAKATIQSVPKDRENSLSGGNIDMAKAYYARICWNSNGWRFPSNDVASLESDTYAAKNRFGHEEWLFNFTWILNGYHYAFLQPIYTSRKKIGGQTIDVLLWAINPERNRVQVGEIKNCEVLTDDQMEKAFHQYEKRGWHKQMGKDIARVGGSLANWSSDGYCNIRFRPEDAVQYDDPLPVAKPTDRIARFSRYLLIPAEESNVHRQWRPRVVEGSKTPPIPGTYQRKGSLGGTVDPNHPKLQKELMELLQKKFGKENVRRESAYVDLKVDCGRRRLLIEIKTDPVARRAIREALGQILEYSYFQPDLQSPIETVDAELFIVAPGQCNDQISAYISLLREKFDMPIQYCRFVSGSPLPEAFGQSA
jgi:hypothetical protein